jgi:hypothetical protein
LIINIISACFQYVVTQHSVSNNNEYVSKTIQVVKFSLITAHLVVQVIERDPLNPDKILSVENIIGQEMVVATGVVGLTGPVFNQPWAFDQGTVLRFIGIDLKHSGAAAATHDYFRMEYQLEPLSHLL